MSDRAVLIRTLEKHPRRQTVIGTKSPHRLTNVQLVEALRQLKLSPDVIIATNGMYAWTDDRVGRTATDSARESCPQFSFRHDRRG